MSSGRWTIILIFILLSLLVASYEAMAAAVFSGRVVEIAGKTLVVQREDGKVKSFRLIRKTKYIPDWKPEASERVIIEYEYNKGINKANWVTIVKDKPKETFSGELTVISPRVNIRAGPGTDYAVVGSAAEGQVLILKGRTGNWYQVFVPREEPVIGWIHSNLARVDSKMKRSASDSMTHPLDNIPPHDLLQPEKPQSF